MPAALQVLESFVVPALIGVAVAIATIVVVW